LTGRVCHVAIGRRMAGWPESAQKKASGVIAAAGKTHLPGGLEPLAVQMPVEEPPPGPTAIDHLRPREHTLLARGGELVRIEHLVGRL
jgi:hypothetical protein